ncbi:MAG TPA: hypothetical protein VJJ82_03055 [Candidatus Nanoarchaeia archaeon]|nr:hypothetical protein [Candidatus Nanoarchaeia archaeon]
MDGRYNNGSVLIKEVLLFDTSQRERVPCQVIRSMGEKDAFGGRFYSYSFFVNKKTVGQADLQSPRNMVVYPQSPVCYIEQVDGSKRFKGVGLQTVGLALSDARRDCRVAQVCLESALGSGRYWWALGFRPIRQISQADFTALSFTDGGYNTYMILPPENLASIEEKIRALNDPACVRR